MRYKYLLIISLFIPVTNSSASLPLEAIKLSITAITNLAKRIVATRMGSAVSAVAGKAASKLAEKGAKDFVRDVAIGTTVGVTAPRAGKKLNQFCGYLSGTTAEKKRKAEEARQKMLKEDEEDRKAEEEQRKKAEENSAQIKILNEKLDKLTEHLLKKG